MLPMTKKVRIIACMLALLMLCLAAVSCADSGDEDMGGAVETTTPAAALPVETTPADAGEETTSDQYQVQDELPADLKFDGETIYILSRDNDGSRDEISVEDYSGEPINDAIYERNVEIESRLGISIDNTMLTGGAYVVTNEIRTLVQSATEVYDMFANSCYSTIMYTAEGLFHDLTDVEYLDLSQPYWSQGFNQVASFENNQYLCAGALGLTLYRYMFVTMFNKDMLAARGIDNLYGVVNDGKWTLDYQAELASQMYSDANGDGAKDTGDVYGFISGPVAYVDPYWSSCKLPILQKDGDNRYQLALDVERIAGAVDKIINLYHECGGSYIYASVSDAEDQLNLASHFGDSRSATATLRLLSVETRELRDMTDKYGIVPIPKMDEAQDGYQTFVHDQFTALGIPLTVKDDRLPFVGAYMEYACGASYRTVIPAYYEVALKDKYLNDTESAEMLDMIYDSIYIDGGVLYTKSLASVHQQLRNIIKSKSNTTANVFKALSRSLDRQLDTLMEGLEKLS